MEGIYLVLNGETKGPFTHAQVLLMLGRGEATRANLAWREGQDEWIPLGQVLTAIAATPPPPPSKIRRVEPPRRYTPAKLRGLARAQNLLMWAVLTNILADVLVRLLVVRIPDGGFFVGLIVAVIAMAFGMVAVAFLAAALRYPILGICLLALIAFVPCLSLLMMVIISGQASKILRAAGVRIGLMGGRASDIKD